MKTTHIKFIIGIIVFLISALQFIFTAQVSVPFWDPGELSAAAYYLQVPHPPGGPLFSIVGRIFYMLPIPGDLGYRMNLLSALASAFTVLLLYLIIIKVIENFKGKAYNDIISSLSTFIPAAIGALALSFCDTFWFNGVESNYFAASTLLYTLIIWFTLIWNEKADEPGSERYILISAYIAGLSGGLHLMSVLTIFIVGLVIVLRKYINNDAECLNSLYTFGINVIFLLAIAFLIWGGESSTEPPTQEAYKAFDRRFLLIMTFAMAGFVVLFRKKILHKNSYYIGLVVGAVATAIVFPGIIRYLPRLLLYIAGDHLEMGLIVLVAIMLMLGYFAYSLSKKKKNELTLGIICILLAIFGFTTYTLIVIRANKNIPMNENDPSTFARLVTYLDREQYGDFPTFKRRWSNEAEKSGIYKNYSSDLDFFLRYQMAHMFNRYVGWNFIGRESYVQDAGIDWKKLFGIPFFLGLFGLFYHFRKDWKMASVFLLAFVVMGYLIAYYQNQQEPQPRDREYFYCGAYLVFALWIGLGVKGLLDLASEKIKNLLLQKSSFWGIIVLSVFFVPVRMFQVNFYPNDRSNNWIPWDFAYNMLQTCEKDAILFTQGDNDTFPLWYMQDVEGVRRDVRVVNLSLANTSWYMKQLKNKPAYPEAKPVPLNMSDEKLEQLMPIQWEPKEIPIPVSKEVIEKYLQKGIKLDSSVINNGKITFFLNSTVQFRNIGALRIQDIIVYDIILANNWERPIYFATTCGPDARIGLDEYLWFHGLALKLEPYKAPSSIANLNKEVVEANLFNQPEGYSKTPQYGYKFRSIADPDVFIDENTNRIITNYRSIFHRLALYYTYINKDNKKAAEILDLMEKLMPGKKAPYGWYLAKELTKYYYTAGRIDRIKELLPEIESACFEALEKRETQFHPYYNPYKTLVEIYEVTGEKEKLLNLLSRLIELYPTDNSLKQKKKALEDSLTKATFSK